MATRRAKVIEDGDLDKVLSYIVKHSRNVLRDKLIVSLTVKAGMRAVEVALMRWECVLRADGTVGDYIEVFSDMTKKKKERVIPLNSDLKKLLSEYKPNTVDFKSPLIRFGLRSKRRASHAMVVWLGRLYESAGLKGCTSHSGRRTFITKASRIVNNHGCSLLDIQKMVGHSRLDTTQAYIEPSKSVRSLVDAI